MNKSLALINEPMWLLDLWTEQVNWLSSTKDLSPEKWDAIRYRLRELKRELAIARREAEKLENRMNHTFDNIKENKENGKQPKVGRPSRLKNDSWEAESGTEDAKGPKDPDEFVC
jgi:hypothetical protein